jgi:hypothetical protein
MRLAELDAAIKEVCPIDGIDSAGGIAFRPEATANQMDAAQAIMDAELPTLDLSPVVSVAPTKEELMLEAQQLLEKINSLQKAE